MVARITPVEEMPDDIDYRSWALMLCVLLDRIEAAETLEESQELCRQRFDIARQHGLETLMVGQDATPELQ